MDLESDAFFRCVVRRKMMMTTATLMRMIQEKEDLGGGNDDHISINIVGAEFTPEVAIPERG